MDLILFSPGVLTHWQSESRQRANTSQTYLGPAVLLQQLDCSGDINIQHDVADSSIERRY